MVKLSSHADTPASWILHIKKKRGEGDAALFSKSLVYFATVDEGIKLKATQVADILLTLNLDSETLNAAFVYVLMHESDVSMETIAEQFGEATVKLLQDVLQMQSLSRLQHGDKGQQNKAEQLRKMLLAMVSDVQAVLIVLAERLWLLRDLKNQPEQDQKKLARDTLHVYAPLANRLGVWHLKWEMEDLCFRYIQPDMYQHIAKSLQSKRIERDKYVEDVIAVLNQMMAQANLKHYEVTGRGKHIYSIYSKMQRKGMGFDKMYDISAFRILVEDIKDCYTVLGILQNTWEQIPEEFDDYISQPKPNGYQSLHTVMIGPKQQVIEVQIRTHKMHEESELGVASHWRYKEGILQTSHYEAKIALLRQIMAWQEDTTNVKDLFADRVYVFTPQGDIIDLPKGSTPLDFAYQIHSEIGHRCRGAKVDGKMVTLTHQLQTGNKVEIITSKQPNPSRDWLNPHLGYLASPRARSRLQHWFRMKDNEASAVKKEEEKKELKGAKLPSYKIAKDIKFRDIVPSNLGIDDLLTKLAKCCKPLPGDTVIGYITQNQGVSLHRLDCTNIANLKQHHPEKFIEINFGEQFTTSYPVDVVINAYNYGGLLRDLTGLLSTENINLTGLRAQEREGTSEVTIYLTLVIATIDELKKIIHLIKQMPNVLDVHRT